MIVALCWCLYVLYTYCYHKVFGIIVKLINCTFEIWKLILDIWHANELTGEKTGNFTGKSKKTWKYFFFLVISHQYQILYHCYTQIHCLYNIYENILDTRSSISFVTSKFIGTLITGVAFDIFYLLDYNLQNFYTTESKLC